MKAPLYVGATVRLKPQSADSFGFDRGTEYRVLELYTRPRYKMLWAVLEGGEMSAPYNRLEVKHIR